MFGVKTKTDGDYCLNCNAKIISAYDFCPKCGNALTENAEKLKEQQQKRIEISLLDELSEQIEDEKSLKVIIEKLKNI